MDISQVDKNFVVETSLNIDHIKFYDIRQEPFSVYGVFFENGMYRRLPENIAQSVSAGVYRLHGHTAGGRVKFITNSKFVAIKAVMTLVGKMPHFALTGSAGFDLYVGKNEKYNGTFEPPFNITDGYESVHRFENKQLREITINFPLYSGVKALYIGLEEDALVKKAHDYKYAKPICFYGSSITQGGCASRPGNAYTSIVSRALRADHINLGFSGSAKAEDEIARYIKALDMSVFVYDYDHNAPGLEYLRNTHQKMFRMIRESNPDLPVLILSQPKYQLDVLAAQRRDVIAKTYTDAIAAGDQNVYFIDGPALMKHARENGTVDGCHPNDLGFYSMARAVIRQLKDIL